MSSSFGRELGQFDGICPVEVIAGELPSSDLLKSKARPIAARASTADYVCEYQIRQDMAAGHSDDSSGDDRMSC